MGQEGPWGFQNTGVICSHAHKASCRVGICPVVLTSKSIVVRGHVACLRFKVMVIIQSKPQLHGYCKKINHKTE